LLWKQSNRSQLGSATLTVAILVLFFVLALPGGALLGRVLRGLAGLTGLAGLVGLSALAVPGLTRLLTRLVALLALSVLSALLTLFLHIVCHEIFLLKTPGCSVF
jgi:hypothetical protein